MTFQEKYAERRKKAQEALKEALNGIDMEGCADFVFKTIRDELEEKVIHEYNEESIKKFKTSSLADEFRVRVEFYPTTSRIEISSKQFDLGCIMSTRQEEFEKLITKKLREVGVSFEPDMKGGTRFLAILKFEDSLNS